MQPFSEVLQTIIEPECNIIQLNLSAYSLTQEQLSQLQNAFTKNQSVVSVIWPVNLDFKNKTNEIDNELATKLAAKLGKPFGSQLSDKFLNAHGEPLCFHEIFELVAKDLDKVAAVDFSPERRAITYKDLNAKANQIAHYLKRKNLAKEAVIGIALERSIDYLVVMLAVMKASCAFVSIDTDCQTVPDERVKQYCQAVKPAFIITQNSLYNRFGCILIDEPLLCIEDIYNNTKDLPNTNLGSIIDSNHLAYIIFSSGTEADPKGICIEHKGIRNIILASHEGLQLGLDAKKTEDANVAQFSSLAFDASLYEMFIALSSGAKLTFIPEHKKLDLNSLYNLYNSEKITVAVFVSSYLLALDPQKFDTLKVVLSTGEAAYEESIQPWENKGIRRLDGYGPSEVTIGTTIVPCGKEIHIGRPFLGLMAYILEINDEEDDSKKDITPEKRLVIERAGQNGELCIAGVGLARRYLSTELTKKSFITHSELGPIYLTGDRVSYRSDGNINSHGRIRDEIKISGRLVVLEELQQTLNNHIALPNSPVALTCIVKQDYKVPSQRRPLNRIVVHVEPKPECTIDIIELYQYLALQKPRYMCPAYWKVHEKEIPRTASKKCDRKLLAKDTNATLIRLKPFQTPRDNVERQIYEEFQSRLGLSEFSIYDDFFDLGGTSMLFANLIAKLKAIYKSAANPKFQQLYINELGKHPTVASLARRIKIEHTNYDPIRPAIVPSGEKGAVYIVHSMLGSPADGYKNLIDTVFNNRPVYGLTANALKDHLFTEDTIEQYAQLYVNRIIQLREEKSYSGPVVLVGCSSGGTIVYEMIRILLNNNYKVYAFIIDSIAPKLLQTMPSNKFIDLCNAMFRRIAPYFGLSDTDNLEPKSHQTVPEQKTPPITEKTNTIPAVPIIGHADVLRRLPTRAGGDCSFHAIFGEDHNGVVVCQDVLQKRKKVSDEIKNCKRNDSDPIFKLVFRAIEAIIMENNREVAPSYVNISKLNESYQKFLLHNENGIKSAWSVFEDELKNYQAVTAYIDEYCRNKNNLPTLRLKFDVCKNGHESKLSDMIRELSALNDIYVAFQRKCSEMFNLRDHMTEAVINEYADFISCPGQWLLPLELQLIAYVFNITVQYYIISNKKLKLNDTYNNGIVEAAVCFNGTDHFEKIERVNNLPLNEATTIMPVVREDINAQSKEPKLSVDKTTPSIQQILIPNQSLSESNRMLLQRFFSSFEQLLIKADTNTIYNNEFSLLKSVLSAEMNYVQRPLNVRTSGKIRLISTSESLFYANDKTLGWGNCVKSYHENNSSHFAILDKVDPKVFNELLAEIDNKVIYTWNIPSIAKDFVSRPKLLSDINQHLYKKNKAKQTIINLYGPYGVGKTYVATYLLNSATDYVLRVWFNASSQDQLALECLDFGKKQNIPLITLTNACEKVKEWLENNSDCLVVYDNVDFDNKKFQISSVLPANVDVIVTSNSSSPSCTNIPVGNMQESEAQQFVTTALPSIKNGDNLIKELDSNPLSLRLACAYIRENNISVSTYLREIQTFKSQGDNRLTVADIVCRFTMIFLEQHHYRAAEFIRRCSYFSGVSFSTTLLKIIIDSVDDIDKEYKSKEIITCLKAYALIKNGDNTVTIHAGLQSMIRNHLETYTGNMRSSSNLFLDRLTLLLILNYPFDKATSKHYIFVQELKIHIKSILKYIVANEATANTLAHARLLRILADIYGVSGYFGKQLDILYVLKTIHAKLNKIHSGDKVELALTNLALVKAHLSVSDQFNNTNLLYEAINEVPDDRDDVKLKIHAYIAYLHRYHRLAIPRDSEDFVNHFIKNQVINHFTLAHVNFSAVLSGLERIKFLEQCCTLYENYDNNHPELIPLYDELAFEHESKNATERLITAKNYLEKALAIKKANSAFVYFNLSHLSIYTRLFLIYTKLAKIISLTQKEITSLLSQFHADIANIENTIDFLQQVHSPHSPYSSFLSIRSQVTASHQAISSYNSELRQLLFQVIQDCLSLIGMPDFSFALVGLGSTASGIALTRSDHEHALVLSRTCNGHPGRKYIDAYFACFTQLFAALLKYAFEPGSLSIDYNLSPMVKEGTILGLYGTVDELISTHARIQKHDNSEKIGSQTSFYAFLTNICLFNHTVLGQEDAYQSFCSKLNISLQNITEGLPFYRVYALNQLFYHFTQFSKFFEDKHEQLIAIKGLYLRPLILMILDLSLFHNKLSLPLDNDFNIYSQLLLLERDHIISKRFATAIKDALEKILLIRQLSHLKFNRYAKVEFVLASVSSREDVQKKLAELQADQNGRALQYSELLILTHEQETYFKKVLSELLTPYHNSIRDILTQEQDAKVTIPLEFDPSPSMSYTFLSLNMSCPLKAADSAPKITRTWSSAIPAALKSRAPDFIDFVADLGIAEIFNEDSPSPEKGDGKDVFSWSFTSPLNALHKQNESRDPDFVTDLGIAEIFKEESPSPEKSDGEDVPWSFSSPLNALHNQKISRRNIRPFYPRNNVATKMDEPEDPDYLERDRMTPIYSEFENSKIYQFYLEHVMAGHRVLDLSIYDVDDQDLEILIDYKLIHDQTICAIILSQQNTDFCVNALVDLLMKNHRITQVSCDLADISDDNVDLINYYLKRNKLFASIVRALHKQTLDLRSKDLRDSGATFLAEQLKDSRNITTIYLSDNHIGNQGAKQLLIAIQKHGNPITIHWGKNNYVNLPLMQKFENVRQNKLHIFNHRLPRQDNKESYIRQRVKQYPPVIVVIPEKVIVNKLHDPFFESRAKRIIVNNFKTIPATVYTNSQLDSTIDTRIDSEAPMEINTRELEAYSASKEDPVINSIARRKLRNTNDSDAQQLAASAVEPNNTPPLTPALPVEVTVLGSTPSGTQSTRTVDAIYLPKKEPANGNSSERIMKTVIIDKRPEAQAFVSRKELPIISANTPSKLRNNDSSLKLSVRFSNSSTSSSIQLGFAYILNVLARSFARKKEIVAIDKQYEVPQIIDFANIDNPSLLKLIRRHHLASCLYGMPIIILRITNIIKELPYNKLAIDKTLDAEAYSQASNDFAILLTYIANWNRQRFSLLANLFVPSRSAVFANLFMKDPCPIFSIFSEPLFSPLIDLLMGLNSARCIDSMLSKGAISHVVSLMLRNPRLYEELIVYKLASFAEHFMAPKSVFDYLLIFHADLYANEFKYWLTLLDDLFIYRPYVFNSLIKYWHDSKRRCSFFGYGSTYNHSLGFYEHDVSDEPVYLRMGPTIFSPTVFPTFSFTTEVGTHYRSPTYHRNKYTSLWGNLTHQTEYLPVKYYSLGKALRDSEQERLKYRKFLGVTFYKNYDGKAPEHQKNQMGSGYKKSHR